MFDFKENLFGLFGSFLFGFGFSTLIVVGADRGQKYWFYSTQFV
jgi:hypothetical protein